MINYYTKLITIRNTLILPYFQSKLCNAYYHNLNTNLYISSPFITASAITSKINYHTGSKRFYPGGGKPPFLKGPGNLPKPLPKSTTPPQIGHNNTSNKAQKKTIPCDNDETPKVSAPFIQNTNSSHPVDLKPDPKKVAQILLQQHNQKANEQLPNTIPHNKSLGELFGLSKIKNYFIKNENDSTHTPSTQEALPGIPSLSPEFKNELDNKAKQVSATVMNSITTLEETLKLKSQSGKVYTTTITQNTTGDTITDQDLILEMKKRELIKDDKSETMVKIILQDNSTFVLGGAKHGIKLSKHGQSYVKKNSQTNTNLPPIEKSKGEIDFMLVTSSKSNPDLFVETGYQKHLLVAHELSTDQYFIVTYFTGQRSGEFLSRKLFKTFQEEQENKPTSNTKGKEQYFARTEKLFLLNKKDIHRVKWDIEYLASLTSEERALLQKKWDELKIRPYEDFNKSGITKEDCIKICLEHDSKVKSGEKHPLTDDQIKLNDANKKKQQEQHQLKQKAIHDKPHDNNQD